MSHEKYFDVVQKLKLVENVINFCQNGAPYLSHTFKKFCLYDKHRKRKIYSRVSNKRGAQNKWGGWQILAKTVNGEVGKNLQS